MCYWHVLYNVTRRSNNYKRFGLLVAGAYRDRTMRLSPCKTDEALSILIGRQLPSHRTTSAEPGVLSVTAFARV